MADQMHDVGVLDGVGMRIRCSLHGRRETWLLTTWWLCSTSWPEHEGGGQDPCVPGRHHTPPSCGRAESEEVERSGGEVEGSLRGCQGPRSVIEVASRAPPLLTAGHDPVGW